MKGALVWIFIICYMLLLGFICWQLVNLSRTLRSAAWRWITSGFILSFVLTAVAVVWRRDLITWAVWGITFLRSYGALLCIAIGFHKLHNDLIRVQTRIRKSGEETVITVKVTEENYDDGTGQEKK